MAMASLNSIDRRASKVPLLRPGGRGLGIGCWIIGGATNNYTCRLVLTWLLATYLTAHSAVADTSGVVSYNFDVKPILSDRCYRCHGPDAKQRKADLRLDVPTGSQSAVAKQLIKPGHPDESQLFQRITEENPHRRMPPADAKLPPITTKEARIIGAWIEQGATWEPHWSFLPLAPVAVPSVHDHRWPRNPIDTFVLARLEAAGMVASPEADKQTLLRRVTLDLTGLPPTLQDREKFINDQSPTAYEKVVDRLLSSDRFGERLAVHWLDLARYSDTYGYQIDRNRRVWPWRDWIIRALNNNMPYDQFLTWQLAGDLLPNATDEQVLATTFNRLHPQKAEGGSTEEEFRVEYVADRVHTFGTAFLGLTLECCRCHDHKYDPIHQREYYELFAFFNNVDECGLYSIFTTMTPTPTLMLADEQTKTKIAQHESVIFDAEHQLQTLHHTRRDAFDEWLDDRKPDTNPLIPGLIAHFPFDRWEETGKLANTIDPEAPAESTVENHLVVGRQGGAIEFSGDQEVTTKVGNFTRNQPFSLSLWTHIPKFFDRAVVLHRSRAWTDAGSRGYQLLIEDGQLSFSLIHFWPGNALRVKTEQPLPLNPPRWPKPTKACSTSEPPSAGATSAPHPK